MRRALLAILIVAHALVLPAPAAGQEDLSVALRFGFDGVVVSERWTPVRLVLTAHEEPVTGTLTLRYRQDGSQDASTTVRFSVTPGVPTPVDVGVCLMRHIEGLNVTIRSDSGRTLLSEQLTLSDPARAQFVRFTPALLVDEPTTLLAIGLDDLAEVGRIWSRELVVQHQRYSYDERMSNRAIEQRRRLTVMQPDELFSSWSVYEGVAGVIVRASVIDELPERVLRALLAWQRGGGDLVVIADTASNAWRRWLPEGGAGEVARLDEPRRLASPDSFMSIPTRVDRTGIGDSALARTAGEVNARAIALTPGGAARGWSLDYPLDADRGLIARGPAGLGFITIVGFDPAHAMAVRSPSSRAIAWAAVLEREMPAGDPDDSYPFNTFSAGSGLTASEAHAIDRLVNACVRGEGIGVGVLLAVMAVLVVFVLGIGPADALVLGRLGLRQWSWLTALVWVAAASVLAVQIPSLTTSGRTNFGRVAITDAVLDERGGSVASWSTAVSTIYAGSSGRVGPEDERAGAWWRGVSPLDGWQPAATVGALGELRLIQRPIAGAGGAQESAIPVALAQRGWTARALLDVAPEDPPIVARVTRGDRLRLELAPADEQIEIITISVVADGQRWLFDTPPSGPMELEPSRAVRVLPADREGLDWAGTGAETDWAALGDLPGVGARGRALVAQTGGDRFALVEILYQSEGLPFAVTGADRAEVRGVVRLAVPITTPPAEPPP